jgi:multiple sugar transport system permease protein
MAGAILALLPMIVAFLFVQRRFIEGIATTGLK